MIMLTTRWNLLRSIVHRSELKDEELGSYPSSGGSVGISNLRNGESGPRLRSRSLLAVRQRKLSRSDGALNIQPVSEIEDEGQKSKDKSCLQNLSATTTTNCNNYNITTRSNTSRYDKSKGKRSEGITKVPEIMSRFLKTSSQRKRRKEGIISRILSKDDIPEYDSSCLLRSAVRKFDTERVIELLTNQQIDVDGAGQNGITALHEASIDGNFVCLKILLSYGAEINGCDCEGFTPLDYAVFGGNFECAAYLIEKGATEDRVKDGQIMYQENFLKNRSNRSSTFS